MPHHTTPVSCSGPAVASRGAALSDGRLSELRTLTGASFLPLECAVSAGLLEAIGQSDAPDPGGHTVRRRLGSVVAGADRALRRAQTHLGARFWQARSRGFVVDFPAQAQLEMLAADSRFVRVHYGPDERGESVITLSLPGELSTVGHSLSIPMQRGAPKVPRARGTEDPRASQRPAYRQGGSAHPSHEPAARAQ